MHLLVGVIHSSFSIRKRSFERPRIGQDTKAFINQTFVPESLESPHDAFHIWSVKSFVIVFKVNPSSLASYISLPVAGVLQHRGSAIIVELVDAKIGDCLTSRDTKLTLSFGFSGQTMTVPTESTLNSLTAHRAVSRYGIFNKTSKQVTVVRQTVGKRWTIVKDKLIFAVFSGVAHFY